MAWSGGTLGVSEGVVVLCMCREGRGPFQKSWAGHQGGQCHSMRQGGGGRGDSEVVFHPCRWVKGGEGPKKLGGGKGVGELGIIVWGGETKV
jgi:hypothetical protein